MIRRKLIKIEKPSTSIEQWYKHATNLDRHWWKSQKKKQKSETETNKYRKQSRII